VQFVLRHDEAENFAFAPLQGETAKRLLKEVLREDSLVLVENFETKPAIYQLGQGAFRILWLLGGYWTLLGWISFLPPFLYNWGYRLIAKHRHVLISKNSCLLIPAHYRSRFLS
jgi:predicted DCC family thiol-disulfide oxidoreductase YuxK